MKYLIPYDSGTYDAFIKDGVKKKTAMAFANMFGWITGKNEIDYKVRDRMEEIGLLTPENEILIENFEDGFEWLLMTQVYEGMLERKKEDGVFKFKNTVKGNKRAIKIIKKMVDKK